jgi:hypothetical protein
MRQDRLEQPASHTIFPRGAAHLRNIGLKRFVFAKEINPPPVSGASQKLRQQRLGHADGSPVTATIYTHVISEGGEQIAAQLGNAVWGVLDPSWTLKVA